MQRCVVHLIRNSLRPVARRDAAAVAAGLRTIYTAADRRRRVRRPGRLRRLAAGAASTRRPSGSGKHAWEAFTPFLAFSPAGAQAALHHQRIESLNYQLRKVTKARGHFPGDDAVVKLLWLAIINIEDKRARERAARRQETGKRSDQPARLIEGQRVMGWREALNELDIAYPGRIR